MPTKTRTLNDRLADLQAERDTLQTALDELGQLITDQGAALPGLYAQAERQRTPDAQQAAESAEQRLNTLKGQQARKIAALGAVDSELTACQAELQTAEFQQKLKRIAAIRMEAGQLADQLDTTPFDVDLWAKLQALHNEFAALDRFIQKSGDYPSGFSAGRAWFDPVMAFNRLLENARYVIAPVWNPNASPAERLTTRQALDL